MILTFLMFCALAAPIETETDISLYRRALAASEHGNHSLAAETFTKLLQRHPESELSPFASLFLAEHLQRAENHVGSYEFIREWQIRNASLDSHAGSSSGLNHRFDFLLARSALSLAAASKSSEEKLLWVARVPREVLQKESALSQIVIRELSKSAVASEDADQFSIKLDELFLRLSSGRLGRARNGDSTSSNSSITFEEHARFAIAEALTQAKDFAEAERYWSWLRQRIEPLDSNPAWLATVYVRSCECLLAEKELSKFGQVLVQSRGKVSGRADLEIRLLESRWLMEQVQFSRAVAVLQSVADESRSRFPALRAEAWWRSGELFFLQKDYGKACAAYEEAIAAQCPEWLSRSRMQHAKCLELAGRIQDAKTAYEQLLLVPEKQHVELARSRLNEIAAYQQAQQKLVSNREQELK